MKYVDFVAVTLLLKIAGSRLRINTLRPETAEGTLVYGQKASTFDASRRLIYVPTRLQKDGVTVIKGIVRGTGAQDMTLLLGGAAGKGAVQIALYGDDGRCTLHYGQKEYAVLVKKPEAMFSYLPHSNELRLYGNNDDLKVYHLPSDEACGALYAASHNRLVDITTEDAASISDEIKRLFGVTLLHNGSEIKAIRVLPN